MARQFQDFDLSGNTLNIYVLDYLMLFQYLNSYFFSSNIVHAQLDFAECSLTYSLPYAVVPDRFCFILIFVCTLVPLFGMVLVLGLFRCFLLVLSVLRLV